MTGSNKRKILEINLSQSRGIKATKEEVVADHKLAAKLAGE